MASNVNVWIDNWHKMGITVPVDQYAVDIHIEWTNEAGDEKEHTETVRFPNILADVPTPWLKRRMEEWMMLALRKKLNMDPESEL